jgi:purine-nucleoside phosphorylase
MDKKYKESFEYLKSRSSLKPETGIVLGTGLGGLVKQINIETEIPYEEIPHFPLSTVEGHKGRLIFGTISGRTVVAMNGRFHYYEGYTMQEVTYPIRIMKILGIREILISNAAGGVNPDFKVGDLMLIRDHIDFFPDNPLRGLNIKDFGPRFPDMSQVYDPALLELAVQSAAELDLKIHKGVYLGNPGPSFETPAEYTHYRTIGADAIGMSTVPEVIVARHMDLKICAISVITNIATPGYFDVNTHQDVQKAATRAQEGLAGLIGLLIKKLD